MYIRIRIISAGAKRSEGKVLCSTESASLWTSSITFKLHHNTLELEQTHSSQTPTSVYNLYLMRESIRHFCTSNSKNEYHKKCSSHLPWKGKASRKAVMLFLYPSCWPHRYQFEYLIALTPHHAVRYEALQGQKTVWIPSLPSYSTIDFLCRCSAHPVTLVS